MQILINNKNGNKSKKNKKKLMIRIASKYNLERQLKKLSFRIMIVLIREIILLIKIILNISKILRH